MCTVTRYGPQSVASARGWKHLYHLRRESLLFTCSNFWPMVYLLAKLRVYTQEGWAIEYHSIPLQWRPAIQMLNNYRARVHSRVRVRFLAALNSTRSLLLDLARGYQLQSDTGDSHRSIRASRTRSSLPSVIALSFVSRTRETRAKTFREKFRRNSVTELNSCSSRDVK